ncbi:MAG: CDP-alcohol phosphatidyltransferase family protein [Kiritimatiellae bacterium]|nr:CDP-alcohol phosphatidyltransferase family protein [Kiritimatiellia bacterium]
MNWRHGLLTCFTFTILLVGMRAILCAVDDNGALAAGLIIIAASLDGLDGTLARRLGGVTDFGARLDTYVDTVCFGVAPGVLLYRVLLTNQPLIATGIAFFTVSVGVLRFTRGCEMEGEGEHHVFRGLPIPIPAVWISLLVLATQTPALGLERTGVLFGVMSVFMWVFAAFFLFLEVSNVRYEKPRGWQIGTSMAFLVLLALIAGNVVFGVIVAGVAAVQVYVIGGLCRHIASIVSEGKKRQIIPARQ